jgi:hypothetical protein
MAPTMFKHCLNQNHIFLILSILVPQAMASVSDVIQGKPATNQSKYRLFQLVSTLQKLKLADKSKKGFIGDAEQDRLWLLEINLKVHRLIKGEETTSVLAKQHKKILKFVKKNVTSKRASLFD